MSAAGESDRPTVFVSYSHKDKRWLERLQVHLKPLVRNEEIDLWDDTRIKPGQRWEEEIAEALSTAQAAVLLISADFLASDYIDKKELPPLLQAEGERGLVVLPVIVGQSLFQQTESLSQFQAINLPNKPLATMPPAKRDEVLKNVALAVLDALERPPRSTVATESSNEQKWNIPHRSTRFFTGRTRELEQVRSKLQRSGRVAVTGIGGVGKSLMAIKYAYRYRDKYEAGFWVGASTREELVTGFLEIARVLSLPVEPGVDQSLVLAAVQRWFEREDNWLLIVDNVDDLGLVREFLPAGGKGHVLLTTQINAVGDLAEPVHVGYFTPEEGAQLLLVRGRLLQPNEPLNQAPAEHRTAALSLSEVLGGLPLALDQAGAFVEEVPSSPAEYLNLYQQEGSKLLDEVSGQEHPPTTITFALAFQKVKRASPGAADLLRFCSFLAPDAIPEEILSKGARELGPSLSGDIATPFRRIKIIQQACRYSLLQRNPTNQTLSIHRLVQAVIREGMDEGEQRRWAERAVRAVHKTTPKEDFVNWSEFDSILPHASVCAEHILHYSLHFSESVDLLGKTASYLYARAQYHMAEPLLDEALAVADTLGIQGQLLVSDVWNCQGLLYGAIGRTSEAEALYLRAIATGKKILGSEHPRVAGFIGNLGVLYLEKGRYREAEALLRKALEIHEKALGGNSWDVARSLNNLALLLQRQGLTTEAEPLIERALEIARKRLGPDHPGVGITMTTLAVLLIDQGRYSEADPLFQHAVQLFEKALGTEHPRVGMALRRYVPLLRATGRGHLADEAEVRAAQIEAKYGPIAASEDVGDQASVFRPRLMVHL